MADPNAQEVSRTALNVAVALAGLAGAVGVSLAAVAAHKVPDPSLATAATFFILHAAAVIALAAFAANDAGPGRWLAVAYLMLLSVTLFSGDIALHTLADFHVFPMAAPIGGSLLILSWVLVALLAIFSARG